jgi:tRNA modification GTPase
LRFDGPSSSTGEDVVELHCHGGRAVVDAILRALGELEGLRAATPGEFTRRAFENGRIDLTEAEGLADLLEAETETQRKAALLLAHGALRHHVERWNCKILELSARAEVAIDYVGEEDGEFDAALTDESRLLADELDCWLQQPRAEPLREGIRVVLAGPPNSGKSSLLNAIAGGEKAIVTDVPGTTRDQIEVPLAFNGLPLVLIDTAGVRESGDIVERIGVERSRRAAKEADILLWLGSQDEAPPHPRSIFVHSRADLADRKHAPGNATPVSAVTGEGIPALIAIVQTIAQSMMPAEGTVSLNRRQASQVELAATALRKASLLEDTLFVAEELRLARRALHRLTGRAGLEDMFDQIFGRFCLGK